MTNISRRQFAVLGVALVVGGWLGFFSNRAFASGGIAVIGGFGGVILTGLILLILAFIALISARQPDGNGGPAARATILAGAVLAAGFGGGWVTATAIPAHQPVQLEASGTASLTLDGLAGFADGGDAVAQCQSIFDSEAVAWIGANSAGTVGGDAVSVSLFMHPDAPGVAPTVVVWIVPAVKGPNAAPQWSGPADLGQGAQGDLSGRATFAALTLEGNESGGQPTGWPLQLSGTLSWTCGDWAH